MVDIVGHKLLGFASEHARHIQEQQVIDYVKAELVVASQGPFLLINPMLLLIPNISDG